MTLERFLGPRNVIVSHHAETREEILRAIAEHVSELGVAKNAEAVYEGFMARERIDKTGIQDGFAVPHCKIPAVNRAVIILLKNDVPVDWPSFDGKPVSVALALLVPEAEAGTTHIHLLAKAAVLLMDERFKQRVRESDDPQELADLLSSGIGC